MPKSLKLIYSSALLIVSVLLLPSCSSPKIKEESIHFHSRITSAGLKHFQITILLPPERNTRRREGNNSATRNSPEERAARKAENILALTAAAKIQETQFCRSGYWFLGNNFYGRKVYLRGECNETATKEDRKKFPDTLTYW